MHTQTNPVDLIAQAQHEHGGPPTGRETYIYFMQIETPDGPIKIGKADDPIKRRILLQCGNPYPLIIRRVVIATPPHEFWLHRMFAPVHIKGEWFKPHPALANLADAIPDPTLGDITIVMDCCDPAEAEAARAHMATFEERHLKHMADLEEAEALREPTVYHSDDSLTYTPEPDESGWQQSSALIPSAPAW